MKIPLLIMNYIEGFTKCFYQPIEKDTVNDDNVAIKLIVAQVQYKPFHRKVILYIMVND